MTRSEIREILLSHGYIIKPDQTDLMLYVYEAAEALIAAEREACARVAEGFPQTRDWVPGSLYGTIRSEIAAAIRERGAGHD